MPARLPSAATHAQVKVRLTHDERAALIALAHKRDLSVSRLLRSVVARELGEADSASGSLPDESAIREMAILLAVELVLKLQEASIPTGAELSRRLLEEAARAAIERLEMVGLSLHRETER